MEQDFGINQGLVEELYLRYRENPSSVGAAWRDYFEGLGAAGADIFGPGGVTARTASGDLAAVAAPSSQGDTHGSTNGNGQGIGYARVPNVHGYGNGNGNGNGYAAIPYDEVAPSFHPSRTTSLPPGPAVAAATELQNRVSALINAYRVRGHLYANLDPLGLQAVRADELSLENFGLDHVEPETLFATGDMSGPASLPLAEIVGRLRDTYCRSIGVEFTYIEDPERREWLQTRMEMSLNRRTLSRDEQILILSKLTDAEIFEQFIHTNYVGAKRFSLEGGESVIPMMELVLESSGRLGVEEIVIGMAHRGRLNVLVNVLEKNPAEIFAGFEDHHPELHLHRGDVKYHLGYSSDRQISTGKNVHMTLAFNPSHLEWVNPVVEGRARAKQDRRGDTARAKVLPLLIHGDAAFAGQGVVAETLNLSELRGYKTGGTLHIVINNQIGFTTSVEDARSMRYATDLTRMLRCPVFHVNGEDPGAVAQVVALATEYRQQFARDVVIDMYCYRKYGHNEADEPRFTQPLMYAAIDHKPTVREIYMKELVDLGQITEAQAQEIVARRKQALEAALETAKAKDYVPHHYSMGGLWSKYHGGLDTSVPDVPTKLSREKILSLADAITRTPEGFSTNPKVKSTVLDARQKRVSGEGNLDWGTAEALAFASLVDEGVRVRLSGQDCGRGTFSHRHAVLFDTKTGATHIPLQHIREGQGVFEVYDSSLSESGPLGFEYGYSLDSPDGLVLWEAQFGDFANCAQVIIDQFISSSEDKWNRLSGLVLLLPHGFEGQGPEHSSARLERFLALAGEDNMMVCNLTTPAQLFHCLRRQVLRPWRKPLVIMSPKSLLRHPKATSPLLDLETKGFQTVLGDELKTDPKKVRKILLCSGKVYYELAEAREKKGASDVAILRLEQIYPLRKAELDAALAPYNAETPLVWVQEEPWNMGAWFSLHARLPLVVGERHPVTGVTRAESASPATGSFASHKMEQQLLLDEALK